jgi:catechol 2,3-dioxygenase-like lactoylglutathione lyase family enzyme
MTHLDHLTIFVRDHRRAARWYTQNLGFEVEFETPDAKTALVANTGSDSASTINVKTRTKDPDDRAAVAPRNVAP